MPLVYLAAGQADKLLGLLNNPDFDDSFVITQIRRELVRHKVDYWTVEGFEQFKQLLRFVNIRVYRGSGKSSALTHAVRLWKMTRDPNLSACIISNVDDKARDFCKQIRATILSPIYGALFPDRVPEDMKWLTENSIRLAGRTVPDKEPCLMVFGHKSSPVGYHFDEIHLDDLVGRENRSVAELAMVRDFLANLAALYNPGLRYPTARLHVGTRWDEDDDDSIVRGFSQCFSLNIPVWTRDEPTDDITAQGKPTSDWYTLDKIVQRQEEILSDPEEGAISWRCNYELDPAIAGGRIFSSQTVDAQKWIPYRSEKTQDKEWMVRPDFDLKTGKQALNPQGEKKWRCMNPRDLYIVAACDQSFSEDGDEWSVGVVGMDQYGHRFVLEPLRRGHGEEAMLDAMLMVYMTWHPRRIGQEKIAATHLIELVLKLDPKYRILRGLVEPIPHGNKPKEWRLRNYVAEMLKMRRLWLHPRDTDTDNELIKYKPGKNAKDNGADCLAMCEVLIQRSLKPKEDEEDFRTKFARRNRNLAARRDPFTGVMVA